MASRVTDCDLRWVDENKHYVQRLLNIIRGLEVKNKETNMTAAKFFKVALEIEQKGIRFYTEVRDKTEDMVYKDIFNDLVQMERGHYKQFEAMRDQSSEELNLSSEEVKSFLKAYPQDRLFKSGGEETFPVNKKMIEIFKFALKQEQDTVDYYTALQNAIGNSRAAREIEPIIEEEKGHVRLMEDYVDKLENF